MPRFTGVAIGFDKLVTIKYFFLAVLILLGILFKLAQSRGSLDSIALILNVPRRLCIRSFKSGVIHGEFLEPMRVFVNNF